MKCAKSPRALIDVFTAAKNGANVEPRGAHWSIATAIEHDGTPSALPCDPAKTVPRGDIATRLTGFSEAQTCQLVNWGYALTYAALQWHGGMQGPVLRIADLLTKFPQLS